MQIVVLAAGHARRYGGLKQLAQVGDAGEAIFDYTAADALRCGFDRAVLVVRPEIRDELGRHLGRFWPSELSVEMVDQHGPAGTAAAVLSTSKTIDGPFAVVNADDLYGRAALGEAAALLERGEQGLVSYELGATVLGDAPVNRGLCRVGAGGHLEAIAEHRVWRAESGDHFLAVPVAEGPVVEGTAAMPSPVAPQTPVSMNLWCFTTSILRHLRDAVTSFDPPSPPHGTEKPPELNLPDVVGALVKQGAATFTVRPTTGRCLGITHPDDLPIVRSEIAALG